jgi:hypothetical protein
MKDIFFHPGEERLPRIASTYHRDGGALTKIDQQARLANTTYFSGAGGLMTDAEDYLGRLNNQVQHLSGRVLRWEPTTSI